MVIGNESVTYSARIPATVGTHTLPKIEGSSSSYDTVPVVISYDKQTQIVTIDDKSMVPFISIILNYL